MTGMPDGAATDKQITMMYKSFHGSTAYASYADNFLRGAGVFESAFNRVPIENNRAGNEARGDDGGEMLELKELLHCRPGKCGFCFQVCLWYRSRLTLAAVNSTTRLPVHR